MLMFKPGVKVRLFRPESARVLFEASIWSQQSGINVDVNSMNDAQELRPATSLHGFDLAVDLDTQGDVGRDLRLLFAYLRRVLPPQYDVVFEDDHVHVEWDARRGPSPHETFS